MRKIILGFSFALYFAALPFAAAAAEWAIARAPGGSPIVARNYEFASQAKKAALRDCNALTPGCEIMANGKSGVCVALATNGKGGWAFATSHRTPLAIPVAVANCKASFGGQCKYVHGFCAE